MRIMKDNLGRLAVWREKTDQWVMYAGVRDMKADELLDPTDEWTELYVTELPKPDGFELRWNRAYPFWNMPDTGRVTRDSEGVTMVGAGTRYDLDDIEREALILLAAVAQVRKENNKERDTK